MPGLVSIPGRALTSVSLQTLQAARRVLGTASLERAVDGKVLVFTGLGSAVEREAAAALGHAGATVEFAIGEQGCPLSDAQAVERLARSVLRRHGGVDVLVNGTTAGDAGDFQRAMQIGYFTPVRLALAFLPGMRARHSGHIVNLRSPVPRAERGDQAAGLSAHAALSSFSRCLAAEMLHERVAVSAYELPRGDDPRAAAGLCDVIAERPKRAGGPGGPALALRRRAARSLGRSRPGAAG